jgi:hypothetical protein
VETSVWELIDAELDTIEQSEEERIVQTFLRYKGLPFKRDGSFRRVNVTNFSAHIDVPRHRFDAAVRAYESLRAARHPA